MRLRLFKRFAAIATAGTVTLSAMPVQRASANPALVAPAAAACVASVGCILAIVVIAGVTYYAITYDGEETQYVPMIDNPDAGSEEWIDYVWADTQTEAMRKCQEIADNATRSGGSTVSVVGQPTKVGRGKRWQCNFRGETT